MTADFENIYDVYCPVLYSIALQLCPTVAKAEEILVETFRKVHSQKSVWQNDKPSCMPLIKLTIETAREHLYTDETSCDFKIREFKNTPLLHQLLVEQITVENYCSINNIARWEVLLTIKKEIKLIQHLFEKDNL